MQKKSSNWLIVEFKAFKPFEDHSLTLEHMCSGPENGALSHTIINFSEIKDFEKMISRCPRCGEIIPNDIKQQIKVRKVVNKYEL